MRMARDKVTYTEDLVEGVGVREVRKDGGDRAEREVISEIDLVEGVTVSQSVREVRKDGLLPSIEDEIMKDDEVREDGNVGVIKGEGGRLKDKVISKED